MVGDELAGPFCPRKLEVVGVTYRVSHPDPDEALTALDWAETSAWFAALGMEIEEFEDQRDDGTHVVVVRQEL